MKPKTFVAALALGLVTATCALLKKHTWVPGS